MAAVDAQLGAAALRQIAVDLQSGNASRVAKAIARVNLAARTAANPTTGNPYFARVVQDARAALRAHHNGGTAGTPSSGAVASAAGVYLTNYLAINLAAIAEGFFVFEGAFFWTPNNSPAETTAFAGHLAKALHTTRPVAG